MTTAAQSERGPDKRNARGPRMLRLGILLGGKIVAEKLIRDQRDVTIGHGAGNTIAVPVDQLPPSWLLFSVDQGTYTLRFNDTMAGRVVEGGEVGVLKSLRGTRAHRHGDAWALPLSTKARGKIACGDLTVLFQFVDAPTEQAIPVLPASVRGSLADRIDPTLAIVLAISLCIHFGVAIYAYQRDPVVKTRTTRIFNETFQRPTVAVAEIEFDRPKEPVAPEPAKEKAETPAADDRPKQRRNRGPRGDRDASASGGSAEEALKLEEEAVAAAIALIGEDFSERGIGGSVSDRDPGDDLGASIASLRRSGARVEIGGGSGRGTRGGRSTVGTGQGAQVTGAGTSTGKATPKITERVPRGRIKVGGRSALDDTSLRPEDVLRRIQSVYMNGLRRCHRDLLKRDPQARGKVTLKFTVGGTGRVTRSRARGFDDGVDRCIENQAGRWRFGVPKDEDGEPTDATFEFSFVLQPD